MALTLKEAAFVDGIKAELEFYQRFKAIIAEVKKIYILEGAESARAFIRSEDTALLTLAIDELFSDLLTKL